MIKTPHYFDEVQLRYKSNITKQVKYRNNGKYDVSPDMKVYRVSAEGMFFLWYVYGELLANTESNFLVITRVFKSRGTKEVQEQRFHV